MADEIAAQINPQSLEWLRVQKHCERRLARLRTDLETPGMDPVRTEGIRGAIAELVDLLQLPGRRG